MPATAHLAGFTQAFGDTRGGPAFQQQLTLPNFEMTSSGVYLDARFQLMQVPSDSGPVWHVQMFYDSDDLVALADRPVGPIDDQPLEQWRERCAQWRKHGEPCDYLFSNAHQLDNEEMRRFDTWLSNLMTRRRPLTLPSGHSTR